MEYAAFGRSNDLPCESDRPTDGSHSRPLILSDARGKLLLSLSLRKLGGASRTLGGAGRTVGGAGLIERNRHASGGRLAAHG